MADQVERILFVFEGKDDLSKVTKKMAVNIGAVVAAVGAATKALFEFGKEMAPLLDVQTAFGDLTEDAGIATDDLLKSMQRLTDGMVPAAKLMETFNLAANLVGTETAQLMTEGLEDISKIALATGQDVGFLFESLVTGVGRESKLILDNLGVTESLVDIKAAYAEQLGITTEELSKEQAQMALTEAVLDAIAEKSAALGDISESNTSTFAQLNARLEDFKLMLAAEVVPALLPMIEELMNLAVEVLPMIMPLIRGFANAMSRLLPWLTEAGRAIDQAVSEPLIRLGNYIVGNFMKSIEIWRKAFQAIKRVIDTVRAAVQRLRSALASLKIPSAVTGGLNTNIGVTGNVQGFGAPTPPRQPQTQAPTSNNNQAVVSALGELGDKILRGNQELVRANN
jgi:phage-related protein